MERRTSLGNLTGQLFFDVGDLSRVTRLQGLKLMNVPLLIATFLIKCRRSDLEINYGINTQHVLDLLILVNT